MDSLSRQQMQNRDYAGATDEDLVGWCQAGNQSAFNELVHRYHTPALRVALSILRDKQDAEDEVQNALWKAHEHISQFNQDAKFSTWLTRIVVNQCLMRLRHGRRARFAYIDDVGFGTEVINLDLCDYRQSPERELERAEVAKVLRREIQRTPPLLRHVFLLRDVQHRPMPELAQTLGISVAAAKSRLLRARAELRSRMRRHHGTIGPATLMA